MAGEKAEIQRHSIMVRSGHVGVCEKGAHDSHCDRYWIQLISSCLSHERKQKIKPTNQVHALRNVTECGEFDWSVWFLALLPWDTLNQLHYCGL